MALNRFGIELAAYANFLNEQNIPIAQYRNKEENYQTIKNDLILLQEIYQGLLIVNDHIDFIEFADGLHLGQEDLLKFESNKAVAVKNIKEKIGEKLLGLSTHNLKEIQEANSFKELEYIGLGAFRDTQTKNNVTIGGKALIEIAKKSQHKVALIGGVCLADSFDNVPQIAYKVIGSDLMRCFLQK